MGQRLTIQVFKNKEQEQPLATLYYHWSAYTESALEELKTFYNNYLHYFTNETTKQEDNLDAIVSSIYQAVVKTGGGFAFEEAEKATQLYQVLKEHYDPNHQPNRNNGIVAFTEEEQNNLYFWSEGNIELYLDEQEFQFNVYWTYNIDDVREYYEHLIQVWFNTENIDNITDQQIIDYCTNNLPKFNDTQYHSIDAIDSLATTFEQNSTFYDANEEMIIHKIY